MLNRKKLLTEYLKITALLTLLLVVIPAGPVVDPAAGADINGDAYLAQLDEEFCGGTEVHPIAESIAETFGVPYDQLMDYYCQGIGFEELLLALETASESNVDLEDVIAARQQQHTWEQIWETYKTLLVGCGSSYEQGLAEELADRFSASYADVMSLYCQGLAFQQVEDAYDEIDFSNRSALQVEKLVRIVRPILPVLAAQYPNKIQPDQKAQLVIVKPLPDQSHALDGIQDGRDYPDILFKDLMDSMKTTGLIGLPPPFSL